MSSAEFWLFWHRPNDSRAMNTPDPILDPAGPRYLYLDHPARVLEIRVKPYGKGRPPLHSRLVAVVGETVKEGPYLRITPDSPVSTRFALTSLTEPRVRAIRLVGELHLPRIRSKPAALCEELVGWAVGLSARTDGNAAILFHDLPLEDGDWARFLERILGTAGEKKFLADIRFLFPMAHRGVEELSLLSRLCGTGTAGAWFMVFRRLAPAGVATLPLVGIAIFLSPPLAIPGRIL